MITKFALSLGLPSLVAATGVCDVAYCCYNLSAPAPITTGMCTGNSNRSEDWSRYPPSWPSQPTCPSEKPTVRSWHHRGTTAAECCYHSCGEVRSSLVCPPGKYFLDATEGSTNSTCCDQTTITGMCWGNTNSSEDWISALYYSMWPTGNGCPSETPESRQYTAGVRSPAIRGTTAAECCTTAVTGTCSSNTNSSENWRDYPDLYSTEPEKVCPPATPNVRSGVLRGTTAAECCYNRTGFCTGNANPAADVGGFACFQRGHAARCAFTRLHRV
jgi:hypothetical protein